MNPTREWLEMLRQNVLTNAAGDYVYAGIGDLLLREGREMDWKPLPSDIDRGPAQQCFINAWSLAMEQPERYAYCEGYAVGHLLPVYHAWCVDRFDGKVVDPTWETGECYIGICFRLEHVTQMLKAVGAVIEDMQHGYPLFTGKTRLEDVVERC